MKPCSYFNTLMRNRRSPGSPSMWGSPENTGKTLETGEKQIQTVQINFSKDFKGERWIIHTCLYPHLPHSEYLRKTIKPLSASTGALYHMWAAGAQKAFGIKTTAKFFCKGAMAMQNKSIGKDYLLQWRDIPSHLLLPVQSPPPKFSPHLPAWG